MLRRLAMMACPISTPTTVHHHGAVRRCPPSPSPGPGSRPTTTRMPCPPPPGLPLTTRLSLIPECVPQSSSEAAGVPTTGSESAASATLGSSWQPVFPWLHPHYPRPDRQPPQVEQPTPQTSASTPGAAGASEPGAEGSEPPPAPPLSTPPPPPLSTPPPPPGLGPAPVPSASTLGAEGAANILVMVEDIPHFRGNFSHKRAHTWLAAVRRDCAHHGMESIDLTDDARWREYICSHPVARQIIGTGVVHFEGRFCRAREPNAVQLGLPPPFGAQRFDFVVWRHDGTACRLHPGGRADALPVYGNLFDWMITPPPSVSTPGLSTGQAHIQQRLCDAFEHYSQTDVISSEDAYRHLHDRVHAWRTSGGNPDHMVEDILASASTPGGWQWNRFLMGRPWGEQLFSEQVTSLVLVLHGGKPCLRITTARHPAPRHIVWHGSRCRVA